MSGAEYLQSIFGTEKDRVNCPFYFKIGACRYGDKCERRHNKPTMSQTLIIVGMYQNPILKYGPNFDPKIVNQEFIDFYEDIYDEFVKYGEIEELNVCDNIGEHMLGNVYVRYRREEDAEKCLRQLTGRFYGGKPIVAEMSPVTDFREASCRQYEMNECTRGPHCNFMHLKPLGRDLYKSTFGYKHKRHRSRSSSRDRKRSRSRDRKSSSSSSSSSRDRRSSRDRDRESSSRRSSSSRKRSTSRERHHE